MLKKNPISDYFFKQNSETDSLVKIEKNLRLNLYENSHNFAMEIRKFFNFHFTNSPSPEVYRKTFTLSHQFEEAFKDISKPQVKKEKEKNDQNIVQQQKIIKKDEKTNEQPIEINKNKTLAKTDNKNGITHINPNNNVPTNPQKSNEKPVIQKIRPLTSSEKLQLKSDIKSLNNSDLKGIITILSDPNERNNSEFFEFDIEELNPKQLRDLDEYVKKCLLKYQNQNNDNQVKQKIQNQEEKINKTKVNTF